MSDDDHSSRLFVTEKLKQPTRKRRQISLTWNGPFNDVPLFGLAPRGVYLADGCYQPSPVSSYLTFSPITPTNRGWNILCCTCRHPSLERCPDVIRLAALWCSDFPLSHSRKRSSDTLHYQGSKIITKNVEHSNPFCINIIFVSQLRPPLRVADRHFYRLLSLGGRNLNLQTGPYRSFGVG